MKPSCVLPPVTPFTVHVTAVSLLPETTAVNCAVVPSVMLDRPLKVSVTSAAGGSAGCAKATASVSAAAGLTALAAVIAIVGVSGAATGAV